jgi:hypothetical protein
VGWWRRSAGVALVFVGTLVPFGDAHIEVCATIAAQSMATFLSSNMEFKLHLLASREYPVVDYQTMTEHIGCERQFRTASGAFMLHMSSDRMPSAEERIIRLSARDALSWLNQVPDQFG